MLRNFGQWIIVMINGLLNYGANRVMSFGLVALGVGGFYIYDRYDKNANYLPVQARVTNVQEVCYLEKRAGRTRTTSDTLACDKAQYLAKNHPSWQDFTVKYKVTVDYDYVSPVDNRTHSGKRTLAAYPDGKKIYRGEIFNIRASKTDPNKSRES